MAFSTPRTLPKSSMFDHKAFLQTVPAKPGVYRMLDKNNKLLYVGKAKDLSKRLASYFRVQEDPRIASLVKKIARIDLNITASETEALLLENNLIKSLKPRYNILFRDDKSYPYLFISKHPFPRLMSIRGKPAQKGEIFGPYTSAMAVREALNLMQKTFLLRQCDDTFFKNRSRPCLQYQIKRCSAPCVGHISESDYARDVNATKQFLQGKQLHLIDNLIDEMEIASNNQDYEQAALLRNQITALRSVTSSQSVVKQSGNADVLVAVYEHNMMVIHMLCIRDGMVLDSHNFYGVQSGENEHDCAYALQRFILQFYLDESRPRDFPKQIFVNYNLDDVELVSSLLNEQSKHNISIRTPLRGEQTKWLDMAVNNAKQAIKQRAVSANLMQKKWFALKAALNIQNELTLVECFDVSHSQGEAAIASCVVFNQFGALKKDYRSFGLKVTTGDDYAGLKEALYRRYSRQKAEGNPIPELILIDGGKGQLNAAKEALRECQLEEPMLVGIAKGVTRKPGLEQIFVTSVTSNEMDECHFNPTDAALHMLQQVRDEAHRFAISKLRKRVAKKRVSSPLEKIPGVGPVRRQELLSYFGGLQGLTAASAEAIAQVPGISKQLAEVIYQALHEKG